MNKTILITGAAKRIGKEIALYFAKKGWNVSLISTNPKRKLLPLKKKYFQWECSKPFDSDILLLKIKSIFKTIKKKIGIIDCLVNCASIFENDDILSFNNKKWKSHFDVNLKAPAILCGEFAKQSRNTKGNIINITENTTGLKLNFKYNSKQSRLRNIN